MTYDSPMNADSEALLPPGPRIPPAAQIVNWLYRPLDFLERNRDRFGDSFSIRFPGFGSPMVLISHPDHVAEMFSQRENGLPPGRTLALEPILGPRSVLLLEGAEPPPAPRDRLLRNGQARRNRMREPISFCRRVRWNPWPPWRPGISPQSWPQS